MDTKTKSYLVYDNNKKSADQGKYSNDARLQSMISVSNLYGAKVEGINEEFPLESIQSACFIPGQDTMLIIDDQNRLIEYNRLTGSLRVAAKRINREKVIEKEAIKPSNEQIDEETQNYVSVQTVPNG